MANYNKKEVNRLINKIKKIENHIFENKAIIQTIYNPLYNKSSGFERDIIHEDVDTLKIQLSVISRENYKFIATNKAIHKKAETFVSKYQRYGGVDTKTAYKRYTIDQRDKYVKLFRILGKDAEIFKFLKDKGLWNDTQFWEDYFNGAYYAPLHEQYRRGGESPTTELHQEQYGTKHTLWGDAIISYANHYLTRRGRGNECKIKSVFDPYKKKQKEEGE